MAKYRDRATQVLQRTSVSSKSKRSTLEQYHDRCGFLTLYEHSVVDSAASVELVSTDAGPQPGNAHSGWKIFVKRR
jgi:hypothetical protein